MSHIWPLKNRENQSVTRAIKMYILKTPTPVSQNSEKHLFNFRCLNSCNLTSEMTQVTVFSRLCQKSHTRFIFLLEMYICEIRIQWQYESCFRRRSIFAERIKR